MGRASAEAAQTAEDFSCRFAQKADQFIGQRVGGAQRSAGAAAYSRNGYHFDVDAYGRTKDIQGTISRSAPNARSRTMQRRAGLPDRRPNEDGGHFIAPRFNGPAEAFNHFAQDANFNRGAYRALEDQWDKAAGAGKKVDVRIMVFYEGQSKRPAQIVVSYAINGEVRRRTFPNERQEKLNAKR
ncbi:hypothetical protein HL653_03210 [Sphingomonas sp. AP4-R1]|uniref:DNA/RNA non-specific endonuclease n=1 Tax=Sphingomonas sp. AP4-R1 TaxID=2735134 RepID=UPI001493A085|nr:DNA/RNA non-specific endonuclease [Sphingomonas sp. AP4-R1]QJU56931.1 hypothetical protein HL653_03210 [Sphingomonas sp. AP4-R1]